MESTSNDIIHINEDTPSESCEVASTTIEHKGDQLESSVPSVILTENIFLAGNLPIIHLDDDIRKRVKIIPFEGRFLEPEEINASVNSKKYSNRGKRWTVHQEEITRNNYAQGSDVVEISEIIGRSPLAVACRLVTMGVIPAIEDARGYIGEVPDKLRFLSKPHINNVKPFTSGDQFLSRSGDDTSDHIPLLVDVEEPLTNPCTNNEESLSKV